MNDEEVGSAWEPRVVTLLTKGRQVFHQDALEAAQTQARFQELDISEALFLEKYGDLGPMKASTLRAPEVLFDRLELVARAHGLSVNAVFQYLLLDINAVVSGTFNIEDDL